ncbi:MAG: hypothetical protein AAGF87_06395 [Bacteroidota bacterium]
MKFNARGLIEPPGIHKLLNEEFEHIFVEDFSNSETRRFLFEQLMVYTERVRDEVTDSFVQWIGGSFTTRKNNPKDIDVVTILKGSILEQKEFQLRELSKFSGSTKRPIDAYQIGVRETDDPKYLLYELDYIYWMNLFSRTKMNRAGKTYNRGFVQLNYGNLKI